MNVPSPSNLVTARSGEARLRAVHPVIEGPGAAPRCAPAPVAVRSAGPCAAGRALATGPVLDDKYELVRLLGRGAFGEVWGAVHRLLGHEVAIKMARPDFAKSAQAARRMDAEVSALSRIRSRHVVRALDVGTTPDGRRYLVMERVQGATLSDLLRGRGAFSLADGAILVSGLAGAVQAVHDAGVVHCDVTVDNVLVERRRWPLDGAHPGDVKLVDFGRSLGGGEVDDGCSFDGEGAAIPLEVAARGLHGTPSYLTPEALRRERPTTERDDLWALAACAFAVVTGAPPFPGATLDDVLRRVCERPPPVPSQVDGRLPPALDACFTRAFARDPRRRFPSARDFRRAFVAACAPTSRPHATSAEASAPRRSISLPAVGPRRRPSIPLSSSSISEATP